MTMSIPMNSFFLQIRWMSNEDKIGLSVAFDQVIAQYDEQTVKEYLEIVKREGMFNYWEYLDDEAECVKVMAMVKSVGGDMVFYVELFLDTLSISDCQ